MGDTQIVAPPPAVHSAPGVRMGEPLSDSAGGVLRESTRCVDEIFLPEYDLGMAVKKWSVSVEERLATRVERRVGDRGLSGFVARAVEHELERDLLDEFLNELDAEFGVVSPDLVEKFNAAWPS